MNIPLLDDYRATFEAWQWHTDSIVQQWMRNPLWLSANRVLMGPFLEGYASSRRLNQFLWGNPSWFEEVTRYFSNVSDQLVEVAVTPHEVIYRENTLRVLRYSSREPHSYRIPLVIVSSLVNRYYILDLTPGRSYVEFLVNQGFDVFLIDWGTPSETDCTLGMEDFIQGYLPNCIQAVQDCTGSKHVNLLGYSMGGVLSLIYTALSPKYVQNLILFATPVDFSEAGIIGTWMDPRYFDVDQLVDSCGNIPAEMILLAFRMLKPASNATLGVNFLQNLESQEHLRALLAVEKWFNDCVPIPGEFYRQFVKATYQENLLIQGKLKIGTRKVNLSNINCPVLNVVGTHDQVVPPACATALLEYIQSTDKKQFVYPFGHLSLSVGPGALTTVWPETAAWLATCSKPKAQYQIV